MTKPTDNHELILDEIVGVLRGVDPKTQARLMAAISSAKRIYVAGCGRSGLMARAFAMRLMHLGCTAYVVGETTTPAIGKRDLLLVCCGKGEKETLAVYMSQAAKAGARCAAITSERGSTIAKLADIVVVLPIRKTKQFGGSLFEQALLVFLDAVVMELMKKTRATKSQMKKRHANLE